MRYPSPRTLRALLVLAIPMALASCGDDETLRLAGTVERKTLELAAPVSEVIVEIPVAEGDRVGAGDLLVQLDVDVAQAELRACEAAQAAADALGTETERELTRQAELRRKQVATQQSLDAARRRRDEAVALVAEKAARIAQANERLEDLTLRSLVSGVVDQLPYEVGERVPAGGVVAVVLADEKPWVRVWLPARAVARVGPETRARVSVEGLGQELTGTLGHVAREPEFTPHYALTERESAHLVYEARVVLENAPESLRAGIPAQVQLDLPQE